MSSTPTPSEVAADQAAEIAQANSDLLDAQLAVADLEAQRAATAQQHALDKEQWSQRKETMEAAMAALAERPRDDTTLKFGFASKEGLPKFQGTGTGPSLSVWWLSLQGFIGLCGSNGARGAHHDVAGLLLYGVSAQMRLLITTAHFESALPATPLALFEFLRSVYPEPMIEVAHAEAYNATKAVTSIVGLEETANLLLLQEDVAARQVAADARRTLAIELGPKLGKDPEVVEAALLRCAGGGIPLAIRRAHLLGRIPAVMRTELVKHPKAFATTATWAETLEAFRVAAGVMKAP